MWYDIRKRKGGYGPMTSENRFFYTVLPDGYTEVMLCDANDKRFRALTGPVSFFVSLAVAAGLFGVRIGFSLDNFTMTWRWTHLWHILTVLALVLVYTTVHELTHGLVYVLFTRRKPVFGFAGTFAYCGVPGVYLGRPVAVLSVLAPFVLYTILFAALLLTLPVNAMWFVLLIVFMDHFGGCFADLYAFIQMLRQSPALLVLDSGKQQRFYDRTQAGRKP